MSQTSPTEGQLSLVRVGGDGDGVGSVVMTQDIAETCLSAVNSQFLGWQNMYV